MSITFNTQLFAKSIASQFSLDVDEVLAFLTEFSERSKLAHANSGIVLVTDYSDKSAALFGEGTRAHKDGLMGLNEEKKKVVTFNGKLRFGPGWVITGKYIKDLKNFLTENEIEFREMTSEEYQNELENGSDGGSDDAKPAAKKTTTVKTAAKGKTGTAKTTVAKGTAKTTASKKTVAAKGPAKTGTAKGCAKKAATKAKAAEEGDYQSMTIAQLKEELGNRGLTKSGKKDELIARLESNDAGEEPKTKAKTAKGAKALPKGKKVAPKSKAAKQTLKAEENAWGNMEHKDTGIVFMSLPVAAGGKNTAVAIGTQNVDAPETDTGLTSVIPLDEDIIARCQESKWRCLDSTTMETLQENDPDMYEQMRSFLDGTSNGGDEGGEADEDEAGDEDVEDGEQEGDDAVDIEEEDDE